LAFLFEQTVDEFHVLLLRLFLKWFNMWYVIVLQVKHVHYINFLVYISCICNKGFCNL
jgi:hypothetical protein